MIRLSTTAVAGLAARLRRAGIETRTDEPLSAHTTLGVGGPVPVFVLPRTTDEVRQTVEELGSAGMAYRVLGAGSNLIAADRGLDFAVIATAGLSQPPRFSGQVVSAAAGLFLPQLVRDCVKHGLAGLEFGIGIPGSVGGALRMNAGGWGSDMSRVVRAVTAVQRTDAGVDDRPFSPTFDYRTAGVGPEVVVTEVTLELTVGDSETLRGVISRLTGERRRTQPTSSRSAGCAFRNPAGESAGRLIDRAGLKGLQHGGAQVSALHGNFVLNRGGACATDVIGLIAEVQRRVRDHFGIELHEEIVVWSGSDGPTGAS